MEMLDMLAALQCALVLLAFWVLFIPRKNSAAGNLPPSPKGLPLIGHLHLLGRVPHVSLRELSKRYGPLMLLRFGSVPTLVVSSSELAKEVLHTQDSVFASRPAIAAGKMFFYGGKDMASLPNDVRWKDARKLCSVELFTTKRLNSFDGLMKEELGHLTSELMRCAEKRLVVTVRKPVREFAFNMTTRILMGKAYFGPSRVAENHVAVEFVELMSLVPKAFGQFSMEDAFPSLSWLDLNFLRWRAIQQRVDRFLEKILAEHREKASSSRPEDFVDLLISHFGWDQTDEIKGNLLDLLLGGTDTSVTVIEWALAELVRNPGAFARAQAELMNMVGPRMVEFDDIPKLEFMQAVVKETMRLHSPLPLLVPHLSTRDCKLASYEIPEKTPVLVNAFAIGRDEKVWADSESFLPERFLGSSINVHGFNFELLPFGAGRRICPGLLLGMKSVQFGLSNLVHMFDWSYPDGVTAGNQVMEGSSGFVNSMAIPLQLRVVPRLVM